MLRRHLAPGGSAIAERRPTARPVLLVAGRESSQILRISNNTNQLRDGLGWSARALTVTRAGTVVRIFCSLNRTPEGLGRPVTSEATA